MKEIFRIIILQSFLFFEFLRLGSLHTLINSSGLNSQVVWINLFQNFFFEIIGVTMLFDRIKVHLMNFLYYKKEKKILKIPENLKGVYNGLKFEFELFSLLIYLFLITTKYYDFCNFSIVDCKGKPTITMSAIKQEHFLLVCIVLCILIFQELIKYLIVKLTKIKLMVAFTKIQTVEEKVAFVSMMCGITINFALPGLYSMMYKKE